MKKAQIGLAVAFVILTSWSASASGAKNPKQGTKDLVAAFTSTQDTAFSRVHGYFNYDHLVSVPIEPHRERLTAEQMGEYSKLFRQLLEMAPFIASMGGKKLEYTINEPIKGKEGVKVGIAAYDETTDMDTDLAFTWRQVNGKWQVVDVTIDGASMLKGYQNQFGRILRKEGADGLLTRLEKRLQEVKSQKKAGS